MIGAGGFLDAVAAVFAGLTPRHLVLVPARFDDFHLIFVIAAICAYVYISCECALYTHACCAMDARLFSAYFLHMDTGYRLQATGYGLRATGPQHRYTMAGIHLPRRQSRLRTVILIGKYGPSCNKAFAKHVTANMYTQETYSNVST
jgi:hypothetical protein